jgi:CcmD family protein
MMNRTAAFITALLLAVSPGAWSQQQPGAQMADGMRADGKIYVVIAVIAVIFVALAAYLIYLDRKLTRIERKKEDRSFSHANVARDQPEGPVRGKTTTH